MVLVVGDEHVVAIDFDALRLVERRLLSGAVLEARFRTADDPGDVAVDIGHDDAVVVTVRDQEPARGVVPCDLAREGERAVASGLTDQAQVLAVQQLFGLVLGQPAVDQRRGHVLGQLTLVDADHIAVRIDEIERRPGARAERLPVLEVGVVENRVLNPQAQDRLAQVLGLALGRELGRVDRDNLQGVGVASFKLPQLRKYMQAVDSSVGPEMQDQQTSAEVLHRHFAPGVEPGHAAGHIGRGRLAKSTGGGHTNLVSCGLRLGPVRLRVRSTGFRFSGNFFLGRNKANPATISSVLLGIARGRRSGSFSFFQAFSGPPVRFCSVLFGWVRAHAPVVGAGGGSQVAVIRGKSLRPAGSRGSAVFSGRSCDRGG